MSSTNPDHVCKVWMKRNAAGVQSAVRGAEPEVFIVPPQRGRPRLIMAATVASYRSLVPLIFKILS